MKRRWHESQSPTKLTISRCYEMGWDWVWACVHGCLSAGQLAVKTTFKKMCSYRDQRDVWVTLVWCCMLRVSRLTRPFWKIIPTRPWLDSKTAPRASLWHFVINVTTVNSFPRRQKAHHGAGNAQRRPAKLLPRVCNGSSRLICIMVFWEVTFMGWKNVHTGTQFSWGFEKFKSPLTRCKIIIQRLYMSVRAL